MPRPVVTGEPLLDMRILRDCPSDESDEEVAALVVVLLHRYARNAAREPPHAARPATRCRRPPGRRHASPSHSAEEYEI